MDPTYDAVYISFVYDVELFDIFWEEVFPIEVQ